MSGIAEIGAYTLALFKVNTKLSGATDTRYIIARDMEDAVDQVRKAYADVNVLYIESVERLTGMIFISQQAKGVLLEALA